MKAVLPIWLTVLCCWYIAEAPPGDRVVYAAQGYVGHVAPDNRSEYADYWNSRLGVPLGSNYCASFVSYILDSAQVSFPTVRSGVAQHFITPRSIRASRVVGGYTIPRGSIAIWKRGTSWMGHTEIVEFDWTGPTGYTIGANTTPGPEGDQRQGRGVYRRTRHIDPTAYFKLSHFTLTH